MEKHLYKLWVVLLAISLGVAVGFTAVAFRGAWKYFSLNTATLAQMTEWNVLEVSSSRYALEANYLYETHGVPYEGKCVLDSPRFLNRYAAENQIKNYQSKRWNVWYRAQNPQISSLERVFPRKQVFHALLTLGVTAYFYFSRSLLDVNFNRKELKKAR